MYMVFDWFFLYEINDIFFYKRVLDVDKFVCLLIIFRKLCKFVLGFFDFI